MDNHIIEPDRLETIKAILALLLVIALMCVVGGPDDEADLKAHAQWMAEVKESGAWVMW